jgi:PAS domain S-box-containing protein
MNGHFHPAGQPSSGRDDCCATTPDNVQGMFSLDCQGKVDFADARAAEIIGHAPEDITGRHFADLLFGATQPQALSIFEQHRDGYGGINELPLRHRVGRPVWVTLASLPRFGEDGVFLGVTGFITDIDEQRRQRNLSDHRNRLLGRIAANQPLDAILDDLCRTLEAVLHRPLHAIVMLAEDTALRCIAAPSLPPRYRTERSAVRLEVRETACARAVRSGQSVFIEDTTSAGVPPEVAALHRDYGIGAVWSFPIIQEGETLGTLALLPHAPGRPDDEEERIVDFALQVARLALAHEHKAEALRQSELRFRDYAELSADWYWEQDAEYRFTRMSGGIYNKGGFRIADSLGRTRWELPIEGVSAAQWAEHRAQLERRDTFHDFTYAIRAADGSLRWYAISGKPVFGTDGGFLGYRGIGRDITEQVLAREKLEKTQRWLEEAVRAANVGLWERDVDTWAFYFTSNWKSLFGYAEGEIGNTADDFDRLVHPDDLARIHAAARAYAGNPLGEYENRFRVRHKDGSWRWVLSRGNILADPVSGQRTWMGCHLDITGQIEAERRISDLAATLEMRVKARTAALEEANRELDAFNFSVSHDLRTPLRAIEGFSQALLEDSHERLDAEGREHLRRIVAATTRMGDLIEALYDLSRLSRAPLFPRPTDLSALARQLAAELREREPSREVEIDIADSPVAEGDARLLRIVLDNLLDNAWKYTAKTPRARIAFGATADGHGRTVYFVRDNGAGFDMRFADKLFRMFHRLHREAEFGGQGVGLTTAQRIVARHGGRIWAEAAPDTGATFFFTLWEEAALRGEMLAQADAGREA